MPPSVPSVKSLENNGRLSRTIAFLAVLAISSTAAADSKNVSEPTPRQLGEQAATRELEAALYLSPEDELSWFGLNLLEPMAPTSYKLPSGITFAKVTDVHGWDYAIVEEAEGKSVQIRFHKSLDTSEKGRAFEAALRDLVTEKLGVKYSYDPELRMTSWRMVERDYAFKVLSSYHTCLIGSKRSKIQNGSHCGSKPGPFLVTNHLSSVSFIRSDDNLHFSMTIATRDKSDFLKRGEEKMKEDMRKQLEGF